MRSPSWKDFIHIIWETFTLSLIFSQIEREAENYNYVICNAILLIILDLNVKALKVLMIKKEKKQQKKYSEFFSNCTYIDNCDI